MTNTSGRAFTAMVCMGKPFPFSAMQSFGVAPSRALSLPRRSRIHAAARTPAGPGVNDFPNSRHGRMCTPPCAFPSSPYAMLKRVESQLKVDEKTTERFKKESAHQRQWVMLSKSADWSPSLRMPSSPAQIRLRQCLGFQRREKAT